MPGAPLLPQSTPALSRRPSLRAQAAATPSLVDISRCDPAEGLATRRGVWRNDLTRPAPRAWVAPAVRKYDRRWPQAKLSTYRGPHNRLGPPPSGDRPPNPSVSRSPTQAGPDWRQGGAFGSRRRSPQEFRGNPRRLPQNWSRLRSCGASLRPQLETAVPPQRRRTGWGRTRSRGDSRPPRTLARPKPSGTTTDSLGMSA